MFASKVEKVDGDLKVTREVDGGLETIKVIHRFIVTIFNLDLYLGHCYFVPLCDSNLNWYGTGIGIFCIQI